MATVLPHLLDASYNDVSRLHPEKLSVKINQTPLSTASMTLPEGEPTISIRQWMEIFGPHGSLGKFRVSQVKTNYGDSQVVSLEHGIATLGDYLTAADTTLSGTPYAIMGTLLGYQSLWTCGTIPNTGSYSIDVNRSNVLSAVLDLLKQMSGYMLTYNFAAWTVGIELMETTPSCECRMRRNAEAVRITMDDNDLCTRVYATGLTDGYMDADTVSTWGIIAKNLGTNEDADAADVQAYATAYLAEYKSPRVSIEISAQDMAAKTGEAIDTFGIGKLCRVALPDWDYTIEQRIITMSYSDLLGDPDDVTLTLSTSARDLSRSLAALNSDLYGTSSAVSSRGSGRGGGSSGIGKLVEYRTAILRNTDDVEILAWDMESAQAAITVNANAITLKVSKDGVISSINQTAESIQISAARIDLSGYVTASQLSAAFADFQNSTIDSLSVTALGCSSGVFSTTLTASSIFRMGTDTIGKTSRTLVSGLNVTKNTIHYDYGGNSYSVTVVTNVTGNTATFPYLEY